MNERDKELAIQCKLITSNIKGIYVETLQEFADLVRADATEAANARANISWVLMCKKMVEAEREACAVLAQQTICDTHIPTGINIYGTRAAKAIRARGE
jgi:endo-alpha-1,4-polygalactosaminidase (GH114 family)